MRIDHDTCQLKEGTEERDRQAERIVRESRQVRVEQVKSQPLGCFCCYFPKLKSDAWLVLLFLCGGTIREYLTLLVLLLFLVLLVLFCKRERVRGSERIVQF